MLYPYPGYGYDFFTELTEISGTGIFFPTALSEVSGTGIFFLRNSQNFRVPGIFFLQNSQKFRVRLFFLAELIECPSTVGALYRSHKSFGCGTACDTLTRTRTRVQGYIPVPRVFLRRRAELTEVARLSCLLLIIAGRRRLLAST